ncbi:g8773 [Coccomyxa elongata]
MECSDQVELRALPEGEQVTWEGIYTDASFREEVQRWRLEDIEQKVLSNAVVLWERYAEQNRRFVEERSEQLKSFANLAALITGFAIVAFLQFDFDVAASNPGVVLAFGMTMALVVGLSINSMSLCGLIHAAVMKTGKMYVAEAEEAEFMRRCRAFALQYQKGDKPPQPRRNIQSFWQNHCEDEWQRAFFMFSASVFVFYANLTLASWIKFQHVSTAAIVMTTVFGLGFFYLIVMHVNWLEPVTAPAARLRGPNLKELEVPMGLPFDWHLRPRRFGSFAAAAHTPRIV